MEVYVSAQESAADEELEQQEPEIDTEEDDGRGKSYEAEVWRNNRRAVEQAYELYQSDPQSHQDDLYKAIISFATRKLYPLEYEFRQHGTSDTVDDFAQRIAIEVWQTIDRKNFVSPAKFFAWLNRVCFLRRTDAGGSLRAQVSVKAPLLIEAENGRPYDNPEISDALVDSVGASPRLPAWVQGDDLLVCELAMEGMTREEIANHLGVTRPAIDKRLNRLKEKAERLKEQERENKFARDVRKRHLKTAYYCRALEPASDE